MPSASSIENTLHPPLSAKLPPPLRALVSNENMESNVEKIRLELKNSDLSRKLAVLSEVWALEVASVVNTSASPEIEPEIEDSSDLDRRKRPKKHGEEDDN